MSDLPEGLKIGDNCPDWGVVIQDDDHGFWCPGRDDYDFEIVDGDDGLKRVLIIKKDLKWASTPNNTKKRYLIVAYSEQQKSTSTA